MIGKRIKLIRETAEGKKISMAAFGERVGVSSAAVNQWEHGENKISTAAIKAICAEFGVSEEWLKTGEGEMRAPRSREAELAEISAKLFKESDPIRMQLFELVGKMSEKELTAATILRDFIAANYKDTE